MPSRGKIDDIFSEPGKLTGALERFTNDGDLRREDDFTEQDYKPLMVRLAGLAIHPDTLDVPFHLVSSAILKLMEGVPRDTSEWDTLQTALLSIVLRNESSEEQLAFAFSAFTNEKTEGFIFLFTVATRLDSWEPYILALAMDTVNVIIDRAASLENVDLVSSTAGFMESLLVLYRHEDDDLSFKASKCLHTLVCTYVKSELGVQGILREGVVESLLGFMRHGEIPLLFSHGVVKMLCTMAKESFKLTSKMIELGIPLIMYTVLPRVWGASTVEEIEEFLSIFIHIAEHSRLLPNVVCCGIAHNLINSVLFVAAIDCHSHRETTNGFEALNIFLSHTNAVVLKNILDNTKFLIVMISNLWFALKESIARRVLQILKTICTKHSMLMCERFKREGGIEGLDRLAMTFPQLSPLVSYILSKLPQTEPQSQIDTLFDLVDRLKRELTEESGGSGNETTETVLNLCKEIHRINANSYSHVTAYDVISCGLVNTLIDYFTKPSPEPSPKGKRKRTCDSSDRSMNRLEQLRIQLQMLHNLCIQKGDDFVELMRDLSKATVPVLWFMDCTKLIPKFQETAGTHKCALRCALASSDPRHNYYLLLSIINLAINSSPSFEAEAVAEILCVGSKDRMVNLSLLKEFKTKIFLETPHSIAADSVLIPIMETFSAIEHDREAPWKRFVHDFFMSHYFTLNYNMKNNYLELMFKLVMEVWEKEPHELEVDRKNLMETGRVALEDHSLFPYEETHMIVKYVGEAGQGPGPTSEFYMLMSRKLEEMSFMWIGDARESTLFPRPYPKDNNLGGIIPYFHLLGRLMRTALCDGYLLDLHFSPAFYKFAILDRPVSFYDVISILPEGGGFLVELSVAKATSKKSKKEAAHVSPQSSSSIKYRGAPLECHYLDYGVPGVDEYKITDDEDKCLSSENIEEYLKDVHDVFFGSGVMPQIRAFREGFGDVLSSVRCLELNEVISAFCGEEFKRSFNKQELVEGIEFEFIDETITEEQQVEFKENFIDVVAGFGVENAVLFLKFVTASNRVPRTGLRMTVTVGERGFATDSLPRTQTCFNQIKLPLYPSFEILRNKLTYAVRECQGVFSVV